MAQAITSPMLETGRTPPQALDFEVAVLGAVMSDREAAEKVFELIQQPEVFYSDAHRRIFLAMQRLFQQNTPIDFLTVTENLRRSGDLEKVGGSAYLAKCVEDVTSAANVDSHARVVYEKFQLRQLVQAATHILIKAYEHRQEAADLLDEAEQEIFRISEQSYRKGFASIKPVLHETFEIIERYHQRKGAVTGVASGFDELDQLTSGFQNSDLVIVAGRPSMGKTAFCLNVARNVAIDHNLPVGFFSLEMASYQLAMRLLCAEAKVDAHLLRTGRLPDRDWQRLSLAVGELSEAPLFIDDTASLSVLEIRAKARRLKRQFGLGMLIIDYLQLVKGPPGVESRQQEISSISRSLKALAKELEIPVIALSQLSRAVEGRGGDKRPMLSDLRESGAIEQDADVVLFIYRPEVYKPPDEQDEESANAEIIIGKQRNGPIGIVKLVFVKKWARFERAAFV